MAWGIFKLKIAIKCVWPRRHAFYHYFQDHLDAMRHFQAENNDKNAYGLGATNFIIISRIIWMPWGIFKLKIMIKCLWPRRHAFYHYFQDHLDGMGHFQAENNDKHAYGLGATHFITIFRIICMARGISS